MIYYFKHRRLSGYSTLGVPQPHEETTRSISISFDAIVFLCAALESYGKIFMKEESQCRGVSVLFLPKVRTSPNQVPHNLKYALAFTFAHQLFSKLALYTRERMVGA